MAVAENVDLLAYCRKLADQARAAAGRLAAATSARKNRWLHLASKALVSHTGTLLEANALDTRAAGDFGLTSAQIDRLRLDADRVAGIARGLNDVAQLPDPVGETLEGHVRPNGLEIRKVRVPLGVILFIYESRPNVTADAAALCVKSGNAVILRGGKEALHTNQALYQILVEALAEADLPRCAVQLVEHTDRAAVGHFLTMQDAIDLAIPRGGKGLIARVCDEARMPVLKHFEGNCHVYVDATAEPAMADEIVFNAKCQRPGVCNAAETLLIHANAAQAIIARVFPRLLHAGVELRGCPRTLQIARTALESLPALAQTIKPATDDDYFREFLDLFLAVKVVDSLDEAITHINKYGSKHTDAIVTSDLQASRRFTAEVDAAAVMVNASTRFHDGYEFGLGAEIGISTDKFHARGPCGLRELTSYKYIVHGNGHVR